MKIIRLFRASSVPCLGFAAAALFMSGCAYLEDSARGTSAREARELRTQRMIQSMHREGSRRNAELAGMKADLAICQENQRRVMELTRQLREESSRQLQQVQQLRELVASLETRLASSDEEWEKRMASLKQGLSVEQANRRKSISEVVKEVSHQIAETVKSSRGGTDQEIAGEYTVQEGDTLSAIAVACEITVEDIKKANNLNSDFIRAGQTLLIPAK